VIYVIEVESEVGSVEGDGGAVAEGCVSFVAVSDGGSGAEGIISEDEVSHTACR